ncbi:hypothetical protein G6F33_007400 [Rhizopus arrhizus]|nr:hypothetical protein G6F24_005962 [Rhizopus arrhizus]KAG0910990.1 hypothetical protein G6F33_007400 [Rhizopus arrhizus]KAG0930573.1 hypothetical protein G6F32_011952 [Rhizopus arrhizus]
MNHSSHQDLYSQDCTLRLLISPFDPSQTVQDHLTATNNNSTIDNTLFDNPSMSIPFPTDFIPFESNPLFLANQPIPSYSHLMTSDTPYPLTPPPQNPSLSSFHPYFNPSENTRTTTNQVQIKRIQQTKRPVRSLTLSEKIDFDDITVAELKEALKKRGLSVTGRKAELIHRLRQVSSPNKRSPRSFEPYPFIPSAPFHLYLNDSYIKKQVPQTNRKGIFTRFIPYSHLLHL